MLVIQRPTVEQLDEFVSVTRELAAESAEVGR